MKRYGVLDAPRVPTMQERFWAKVDKQGENGCWLWTASINPKTGYGQFFPTHGTRKDSHRLSYELLVGAIPDGLELDHLCRVPACCRPSHLGPVTHQENMRRSVLIRSLEARTNDGS